MHLRQIAVAASVILLGGCGGDKTTGVVTGFNGALSFSYTTSGSFNGTFNASGTFNAATQETVSWAVGGIESGEIAVGAATPRNSTSHDFFSLFAERSTAGTSSISSSCSTNCAGVGITFGAANTGSTFLQSCVLTSGTVVITEVTSTRIKGTFSGTGTCFAAPSTTTTFTVTGGTFDVAIVSNVP